MTLPRPTVLDVVILSLLFALWAAAFAYGLYKGLGHDLRGFDESLERYTKQGYTV